MRLELRPVFSRLKYPTLSFCISKAISGTAGINIIVVLEMSKRVALSQSREFVCPWNHISLLASYSLEQG
jgi:hypothetical protein